MYQIQHVHPAVVVHELISKSYGTYLIRHSTANDEILSEMRNISSTDSDPFVVLSVRVDESSSPTAILNYRLPLIDEDLLAQYSSYQNSPPLPELKQEWIVNNSSINWNLDEKCLFSGYSSFRGRNEERQQWRFAELTHPINVYLKTFSKNSRRFQHEFSILRNLSYFHLVSFYGLSSMSESTISLVFADHGRSLKEKLPLSHSTNLSIRLTTIAYQIAQGMIYLQHLNLIHRNLQAKIIFEDQNGFIRIGGFNQAIFVNQSYETHRETSTQLRRLAPECLPSPLSPEQPPSLKDFSFQSDLWAFALILIELVLDGDEDLYPYIGEEQHDLRLISQIKLEQHTHQKPDDFPSPIYDVIKQCWTFDPKQRLSFVDVREKILQLIQ